MSAVNAAGNKLLAREPLNKSARSAFPSEKPQIVRCDASDSSLSYGRVAQRARCGSLRAKPLGGLCGAPPPSVGSSFGLTKTTPLPTQPGDPPKPPPPLAQTCFRGSLAKHFDVHINLIDGVAQCGLVSVGGHGGRQQSDSSRSVRGAPTYCPLSDGMNRHQVLTGSAG